MAQDPKTSLAELLAVESISVADTTSLESTGSSTHRLPDLLLELDGRHAQQ